MNNFVVGLLIFLDRVQDRIYSNTIILKIRYRMNNFVVGLLIFLITVIGLLMIF